MKYKKLLASALIFSGLLTSCADIDRAKQIAAARGTGLNRFSFGPLNPNRPVSLGEPVFLSQCFPSNIKPPDEVTKRIANSLFDTLPTKWLLESVGQVTDPLIEKEDLGRFFAYYKGEAHPLVRLIHRDDNYIDFWFDGQFLRYKSADAAAQEYCGYRKKTALFVGYSESCGKEMDSPLSGLSVKTDDGRDIQLTPGLVDAQGQKFKIRDSDVIVAYNCVGGPQ